LEDDDDLDEEEKGDQIEEAGPKVTKLIKKFSS
jgi:hypothetical protein